MIEDNLQKVISYYWMRYVWQVIKDENYYSLLDVFRDELEKEGLRVEVGKDKLLVLNKQHDVVYVINQRVFEEYKKQWGYDFTKL